jgi:hypothetical protein
MRAESAIAALLSMKAAQFSIAEPPGQEEARQMASYSTPLQTGQPIHQFCAQVIDTLAQPRRLCHTTVGDGLLCLS